MSLEQFDASALELDVNYGYLSRTARAPRKTHPQIIVNSDGTSMLRALREELKQSSSFTFSVAFVSPGAIALLKQELVEYAGRGRIVTSDYLGFNSPAAFRELLNLARRGFDVRLHDQTDFHPKGYVFEHGEHVTAIVGSSNLTKAALVSNHEWNLRVSSGPESDLTDQFGDLIERQLANSVPLTQEWVDRYTEHYVPLAQQQQSPVERALQRRVDREAERGLYRHPRVDRVGEVALRTAEHIVPNAMQQEALLAIDSMRQDGKRRAVVISATGTGKTILSALDVRSVDPERLLFVVHREQILDRAIEEFQRVLAAPADQFGKLTGTSKHVDARYVFATIQTLSRPDMLAKFAPDAFDYILVDEVHRAGADSYVRMLRHFAPKFLLGMTATPERSDGFNVFELFDYNVPYEIRLNKALEADMLAPFHYYGVTDVEFEDGSTIDELSSVSKLAASIRVNHIVDAITTYGHAGVAVKGLMFCSRKDEARGLSAALNQQVIYGHRLRTVALTGDDSIERRERVVEQLEAGELDYILTVDVFNEGVDIPSVNQVVMLRQTQSAIVFVQQLGRGLRKAPDKDYLVVIDFIGNYANNYLIPVALFGDESLSKESLRQHLVSAEEVGVVAGLSSVRFDRVSQERVLASIGFAKFDHLRTLRSAIESVQFRIGRVPDLYDFYLLDAADPVLLATVRGNYPNLLQSALRLNSGLTDAQLRYLTMMSAEVLAAKRLNEVVLIRFLLEHPHAALEELAKHFEEAGISSPREALSGATATLSFAFHHQLEQRKYGTPLLRVEDDRWILDRGFTRNYRESNAFRAAVDDLLSTAQALIVARYPELPFTRGRLYTRKDASRLLGWSRNASSTLMGYTVHRASMACPIFVTLHKSSEISSSTAYEDELIDRATLVWYTRTGVKIESAEVTAILSGDFRLPVFAKKDDLERSNHYFLGYASASNAEPRFMQNDKGSRVSVVRILLHLDRPVDAALFDYFRPVLT